MAKRSGQGKSYKQRVEEGLKPVFVWLPPDAHALLQEVCSTTGMNMTEVITKMLLETRTAPRRKASPMPGTAAELAARVRQGGDRRKAVVIATGQVATAGKLSRG